MPRVVVIVMDGTGAGALPDFAEFGDAPGANTLANTAERLGGLALPTLGRLGLGGVTAIRGVAAPAPEARYGRLREKSRGKDTITGHWEMAGIITPVAFPTYPNGFPSEVVNAFAAICGKVPLGNKPASGTEIIAELGPEHQASGAPILYTSADSVFQVAAHEQTVPLEVLYDWCERARAMLVPPHNVNRVIARPFIGTPGAYQRTPNRRDYALEPPPNLLDRLSARGIEVRAVGKIGDIYCERGITSTVRIPDNTAAMHATAELMERTEHGLIFTNLNDFDSKYGHRRDVRGFGHALEELDTQLGAVLERMRAGDRLLLTADHGCDPTAPGTDHTREYVPYVDVGGAAGDAGILEGLDTIGAVAEGVLATRVPL